jgi:hypothetical protein
VKVLVGCEESQAVCIEFRKLGHEAYSCDILQSSGGHPEWHIQGDVIPVLDGWRKVVHADECLYDESDEDREFAFCQKCQIDYSECACPGPTQEDDNNVPFEYKEFDGVAYARPHGFKWDCIIGFPPCTDLAVSGAAWFEKKRTSGEQRQSLEFFLKILNAPCDLIAVENPVGIVSGAYVKKWFPDIAEKYGLPLKPSQIIHPYQFGDSCQKATCLWLKKLTPLVHTNIVDKGEMVTYADGTTRPVWFNKYGGKSAKTKQARSKTFPGIAKAMAEQWGALK